MALRVHTFRDFVTEAEGVELGGWGYFGPPEISGFRKENRKRTLDQLENDVILSWGLSKNGMYHGQVRFDDVYFFSVKEVLGGSNKSNVLTGSNWSTYSKK